MSYEGKRYLIYVRASASLALVSSPTRLVSGYALYMSKYPLLHSTACVDHNDITSVIGTGSYDGQVVDFV